jgi:thymidine phosphorylase
MSADEASARLRGLAPPGAGPVNQLVARWLPFDTFRENVVVLSRHCTVIHPERLMGVRKLEVRAGGLSLLAAPMICDDPSIIGPGEVGLPLPLQRRLGVADGGIVETAPARPERSLDFVRAKVAGETLTAEQYQIIARDLANHRWSDMEVAAFLIACASFMTADETLDLTRAMVSAGRRLSWDGGLVVDKHCIGGIPGNRTSLIVTPIVAAHGLRMPKTSSRAITSPAGTADTMEVLARVDLDEAEMRYVVETCGACVIWGGRVNLSPADDVLISVERPLSIDTSEQMVASILSKKIAAGANHLVLDVPVGPTAKVRSADAAHRLKKLFEFVAGRLGLTLDVVLTDGSQPIGNGIGPVLEARDVMAVLDNRPDAPTDLREKAIALAGRVLEADPELGIGDGARRARDLLESGAARRKMAAIMEGQGGSPIDPRLGGLTHEVTAPRDSRIAAFDCLALARIARLAGAPNAPGAGIDLLVKVGDEVKANQPIYRLHGAEPSDFRFAVESAADDSAVRLVW